MVANQLEDLSPVTVHGGIPATSTSSDEFDRARLIYKFKTDPRALVLVANPAACAESISLHKECHNAVYVDRSFNCAHYLQSLDRIHRLGLGPDDETSYHILLASNSVDETVHLRLRDKMQNMRNILDGAIPGELPGYWSEDLGEEEEQDFELVESHIKTLARCHECEA
jgi:SNF2 family DNA or RNA helicase